MCLYVALDWQSVQGVTLFHPKEAEVDFSISLDPTYIKRWSDCLNTLSGCWQIETVFRFWQKNSHFEKLIFYPAHVCSPSLHVHAVFHLDLTFLTLIC